MVLRRRDPQPAVLASEIDSSVLSGSPPRNATWVRRPSHRGVRARAHEQVAEVQSRLAATANPAEPRRVNVSQPSDALEARAKAKSALTGLFLGLGAVALLVGGVGVANIMVISVLERRGEIGLRRALGARRLQIRAQFLSEAVLLSLLGGAVGVLLGASRPRSTPPRRAGRSSSRPSAGPAGSARRWAIGAIAGLLPALRGGAPVADRGAADGVSRWASETSPSVASLAQFLGSAGGICRPRAGGAQIRSLVATRASRRQARPSRARRSHRLPTQRTAARQPSLSIPRSSLAGTTAPTRKRTRRR